MDSQIDQLRTDYDAVPYLSDAFAASHPDNLRTIATLAGFAGAADVTRCRVLEIGCAIGRNLIPMAQTLPGSTFVGIDLSPKQIEIGKRTVSELGLANIELRVRDLMDFGADEPAERFDYIIAHGIYSWVPAAVRDRLFDVCGRMLSPAGLAYISYLALPGSQLRQIVRDLSAFHCRGAALDPLERAARTREAVAFAAQAAPGPQVYKSLLSGLDAAAKRSSDWSFLHDELELVNHAVYLEQFVAEAARHQLRYVADAHPTQEIFPYLLPATQQQVRQFSTDLVKRQQYLDYLEGRAYHASILCRADAGTKPEDLRFAADPQTRISLVGMHVAGRIVEEAPDGVAGAAPGTLRFGARGARVKLMSHDPLVISAYRTLRAAWPRAMPFEELLEACGGSSVDPQAAAETLTRNLMLAYYVGIVELWTRPTIFVGVDPQRPRVTPLARLEASTSASVVNLRHQPINPDAALRQLLQQMDGTRSRDELFELWMRTTGGGGVKDRATFDRLLAELVANSCVLPDA